MVLTKLLLDERRGGEGLYYKPLLRLVGETMKTNKKLITRNPFPKPNYDSFLKGNMNREEVKSIVKESLYREAEAYMQRAKEWTKFNGDPQKGFETLIKHYRMKANILLEVIERL